MVVGWKIHLLTPGNIMLELVVSGALFLMSILILAKSVFGISYEEGEGLALKLIK
jgi:hypothetical protein